MNLAKNISEIVDKIPLHVPVAVKVSENYSLNGEHVVHAPVQEFLYIL